MTTETRIYVACIAAYNSGILHGRWLDVDACPDTLRDGVREVLAASPCPNVRVACPDCMGTGESFPDVTCKRCEGRGTIPSAEEWAIHDYEGFPSGMVEEYTPLSRVCELAALVNDHDVELVEAAFDATGSDDVESLRETVEGAYIGEFASDRDLGDYLLDELGYADGCPERLLPFIDTKALGRSFTRDGDITLSNGHAFWNR